MSANRNKIALTGKMHSGKTTVRKILTDSGHGNYQPFAFADAVKDVSVKTINMAILEIFTRTGQHGKPVTRGDIEKEKGFYRPVPQFIGTLGRRIDPDLWVDILKFSLPFGANDKVVIDDLRFKNEERFLRANDYTIVKVYRPEDQRRHSIREDILAQTGNYPTYEYLEQIMNADSEIEVGDITPDYVINNDSSWVRLEKEVWDLLSYLP
jgi:hypothetical protein